MTRGDDTPVHITETGLVKGGSNDEGKDGDELAAAIVNIGNAGFTFINDGTLIGDLSPNNSLRIAFVDGAFAGVLPDDGDINDARFENNGRDDFVFSGNNTGDDVITDSTVGRDDIDLSAYGIDFADLTISSTGGGSDTRVEHNDGGHGAWL